MRTKYPAYAWVILVVACLFVGGGFIWLGIYNDPHIAVTIVMGITGGVVATVPLWVYLANR